MFIFRPHTPENKVSLFHDPDIPDIPCDVTLTFYTHTDLKALQLFRIDPGTGKLKNDVDPLMIFRNETEIAIFLCRIQHQNIPESFFTFQIDLDIETDR